MIDRRKFLQGAAALFVAPAIVKEVMPLWIPPEPKLLGPLDIYESDFGPIVLGSERFQFYELKRTATSVSGTVELKTNGKLYRKRFDARCPAGLGAHGLDQEICYHEAKLARQIVREVYRDSVGGFRSTPEAERDLLNYFLGFDDGRA